MSNGRSVDAARMNSNSLPLKQRLAIVGAVLVAGVIGIVILIASQTSNNTCLVNGLGNRLCGDSARAWCAVLDRDGGLDSDSYQACLSTGWTRP